MTDAGAPSLWTRFRAVVSDAASYRSWTLNANDGIIATAGLLQGFGGAGAGDQLLLFTATAATIAGGLSAGGAKWAEIATEREAQLRVAAEEKQRLQEDPHREMRQLTELWEERGQTPSTAALAFMLGAAIPLLITWFAPLAIETEVILVVVTLSLVVTSIIAAKAGHLTLRHVLLRTLAVGLGTMGVSYLAGLVLF